MNSPAYTPIPNSFKRRLQEGEKLIGCWQQLTSPFSVEVIGLAGFDWMLLDAEHAPNDMQNLVMQLMALKDSASAPVVRPQSNDPVQIKRLLDAGFYNFLVPFVENAQQATAAVAATRYPPEGIRGVSVATRSNRYGTVPDYQKVVNHNIVVAVQIETRSAVADIEAICAVPGVDVLFIGPSDLAAGYGYLGDPGHPEVQAAIATVVAAGKKHGVAVGILAPVEADARRYIEMGITMVAVGSDIGLLRAGSQTLRDRYAGA
ncbi:MULTISPECIES: 2-dehydro-3-deoxyglucarate aldolase [unclassified Uliginosibacterium]|uniref:2-dehydro-3-deoxyglucarate aldolase n=1 Tax=unclassified Uliginosibacterium TaxID=2621521 RepID=UPI0020B14FB5|nr:MULTISPECIES: 2-dehydro-3-deoxyglucarate aldolase [unclassified Uliginosibacterium]MDO6386504.1 2-dehydro-3-deoxyglucarate aldolase [Uliginosibacterium sp. 31-12]